jgi:feruloyl esterase
MAHGTPLAVCNDENSYGAPGPFLLDVGISSSFRIATFWGLTEPSERRARSRPAPQPIPQVSEAALHVLPTSAEAPRIEGAAHKPQQSEQSAASHLDIGSVITKALKAAGLMK